MIEVYTYSSGGKVFDLPKLSYMTDGHNNLLIKSAEVVVAIFQAGNWSHVETRLEEINDDEL